MGTLRRRQKISRYWKYF